MWSKKEGTFGNLNVMNRQVYHLEPLEFGKQHQEDQDRSTQCVDRTNHNGISTAYFITADGLKSNPDSNRMFSVER